MMETVILTMAVQAAARSRKAIPATQASGTPSAKKFAAMDLTWATTTATMATPSQAMDAHPPALSSSALTASLIQMERLCALLCAVTRSYSTLRDAMMETT